MLEKKRKPRRHNTEDKFDATINVPKRIPVFCHAKFLSYVCLPKTITLS